MSKNLNTASNHWAYRPDDERYENLPSMYAACKAYAEASVQSKPMPFSDLRTEVIDGNLMLAGKTDRRSLFTHYAFGQLCKAARSPADFVRQLPATLASQVVNNRIKAVSESADKHDMRVLFHTNGHFTARSVTSEMYDRVWNHEVIARLFPFLDDGWRVPPGRPVREGQRGTRKATIDDILPGQEDFGLSVKVGDLIAPCGLYAAEFNDMFAFLVDPKRTLDIGKRQLMRGMFVYNTEVGNGALVIDLFKMDNVCGNHICWGVQEHKQIRVRHVAAKERQGQGDTLKRAMAKFEITLSKEGENALKEEQMIKQAQKFEIAGSKEDVIDAIFRYARGKGLNALTKGRIESGYEVAERFEDRYGNPRTVWAMVSGLTQWSQTIPYTDQRHEIDQAAGKLMEIAF